MSKRRRIYLVLSLVLLVGMLLIASVATRFLEQPVAPPHPRTLTVSPGAPLPEVSRELEKARVVSSALGFRLLARLRGDAGKLQAGEYRFARAATPGAVLGRLVAGDVLRHRVTIPEGWTLKKIATRLADEGLANRGAFLSQASDPAFLRSLGIDAPSLEGYLFPETYTFVRGMTPAEEIRAMLHELNAHLTAKILGAARARGLNRRQLLTLASIIQKETGDAAEMPLIASVFYNRLRRRMPLQSDPTVIYGIKNFTGNLTRKDLKTPTPYNTYCIRGLPPGPIASPGEAAIEAAAFPARTHYLYFVSRGDGTHAFSRTLRQHDLAVDRYQLHR
jgi:UPF0755 protein